MSTSINKPLVIIGTGLAGYNLAKEFRKLDQQTSLVLITQDDGHFYSKPQLSTAVSLNKTPNGLIVTDVETMSAQLSAKIYTHSTVYAIHNASKVLELNSPHGTIALNYKDLVFATGALPKPFPLLEKCANHHRINNRLEYAHFIDNLDKIEHLAIIGSGLVGCEFAHDFANKVKLSVITLDPQPLHYLVPARIGQALQQVLEQRGIAFYTQAQIQSADLQNGISLQLATQKLNVDCVLTAIGLSPNTALAKIAKVETRQGIVVDDYLKTTVDNIYALGDCAEIAGLCRQYVAPILQSARALAQTLTGKPTVVTFPPTPISLKVNSYPVIVHPPANNEGEWQFEEKADGIKAFFIDNNEKLQGYALSGNAIEHRQACLKALQQPKLEIA